MSQRFNLGDKVRKTKGSNWHGTVVGTYSTDLTPEGYAVESATERGSVQIYPAAALELWEEPAGMRDEFEEAYARRAGCNVDSLRAARWGENGYRDPFAAAAWFGWVDARAALVVELPAIEAWDNDGRLDREKDEEADVRVGLVPRVEVRAALEAAGVRVAD